LEEQPEELIQTVYGIFEEAKGDIEDDEK